MTYPYMLEGELVAKAMNISVTSLYKLAREGTLPEPLKAVRLGKLWRFKRTEVEAFLGASLDDVLGSPDGFVNLVDEVEHVEAAQ